MIDLKKEEFLHRFDIRLMTFTSVIFQHEKFLASQFCKPEQRRDFEERLDTLQKSLFENISKVDAEIQERFEQLRKESEKSQGKFNDECTINDE